MTDTLIEVTDRTLCKVIQTESASQLEAELNRFLDRHRGTIRVLLSSAGGDYYSPTLTLVIFYREEE